MIISYVENLTKTNTGFGGIKRVGKKGAKEKKRTVVGIQIAQPPCVDVIPWLQQLLTLDLVGQPIHLLSWLYISSQICVCDTGILNTAKTVRRERRKVGKCFTPLNASDHVLLMLQSLIVCWYTL